MSGFVFDALMTIVVTSVIWGPIVILRIVWKNYKAWNQKYAKSLPVQEVKTTQVWLTMGFILLFIWIIDTYYYS